MLARWAAACAAGLLLAGCASQARRGHALSSTSSTPSSAAQPLLGPTVIDAQLFPGGAGYARTPDRLLWTDDYGTHWRDVTPAAAQLAQAGVTALPDGHVWVAVAPQPAGRTVSVYRRSRPSGRWLRTTIELGTPAAPDGSVSASISFLDPDDGWLLITSAMGHSAAGELLQTTDGGASWALVAGPREVPGGLQLHFVTPRLGFVVHEVTGAYWLTRDGGRTWSQLDLTAPPAKPHDTVSIVDPPMRTSSGTLLIAASIETPVQGDTVGLAIYTTSDSASTWTTQFFPSHSGREGYTITAVPGALSILTSSGTLGSWDITWQLATSTDAGLAFITATDVQRSYPTGLSAADTDHLWVLGHVNGCHRFKADCFNTTGLFATTDAGHTWHQIALPR